MPHSAPDIDDLDEDLKSKSELKREMLQLQDFASQLIKMSKHQRSRLPLTEEIKDALVLADKILNKHEALKRHVRYLARILLETDLAPIKQAIDVMANKHQQESAKFIRLEQLRDKLIEEGNSAVEEIIAEFPQIERQHLRQLVRNAVKEKKAEKVGKHYRDLFSYLKENASV